VSRSLIGGGAPVVDNFSSYPHTVMLGSYISHVIRSTVTTIEPISSIPPGSLSPPALTRIGGWPTSESRVCLMN
jgi:hypothetical protein